MVGRLNRGWLLLAIIAHTFAGLFIYLADYCQTRFASSIEKAAVEGTR